MPAPEYEFDFFISHASEDKESWAIPLTEELVALGCSVWIDAEHVFPGLNFVEEINEGFGKSKYIVAIISQPYLNKKWTIAEMDIALHNFIEGQHGRLLPILHGVDRKVAGRKRPLLKPLLSLDTTMSVRQVAAALIRAASRAEHAVDARTTPQLCELASNLPDPVDDSTLTYLKLLAAQRKPEPAPRRWPAMLAVCLGASALTGASISTRFNPSLGFARRQVQEQGGELTRMRDENDKVSSSLKIAEADLVARNKAISALNDESAKAKVAFDETRKELLQRTTERDEGRGNLAATQKERDRWSDPVERHLGGQTRRDEVLKATEETNRELSQRNEQLRDQVEKLKVELHQTQEFAKAPPGGLVELERLKKETSQLRAEGSTLRIRNEQLENYAKQIARISGGAKCCLITGSNMSVHLMESPSGTADLQQISGSGGQIPVRYPEGGKVLVLTTGTNNRVEAKNVEALQYGKLIELPGGTGNEFIPTEP